MKRTASSTALLVAAFFSCASLAVAAEPIVYALKVSVQGDRRIETYVGNDWSFFRADLAHAVQEAGRGAPELVGAEIVAPSAPFDRGGIVGLLETLGVDRRNIALRLARTSRPTEIRLRSLAAVCAHAPRQFDTLFGLEYEDNRFDHATGCATRSSIEAQVANKTDLARGRGSRLSDGDRAAAIVSHYRDWKPENGQGQTQQKTNAAQ
ncbi:hypothetical protein T281_06260 [Rhodomicrobium udaipurense JA643]|uniref:Pilus assembly protein CpaD n=1 Tax=Rhodomicrobium udaipurense TaxID=1202716 RepID=A0A8I1GGJ8_9HYPH|nr:CpaD family pilus assembly lipoprotein [Rhodomicrobium udaipurense]KAI95317.1 hypothetical protein T281_06260 [Rhodomicrobium udaipurense JA643]MBJ7544439.1 hypothetical protein [Rhodomicrobium udaipurense]